MTIPTKLWLMVCAAVFALGGCAGYAVCDAQWTQRDTDRKLTNAKVSAKLSEEYRVKEKKLNETIGEIETRAINEAANMETEYKAVMDRLRNASAHPTDRLRIKPTLTCRAMPNSTSTTGNGNEEVQAGLSIEAAGRIIGVGAECDQVVLSLQACQTYVESLRNEKPLY